MTCRYPTLRSVVGFAYSLTSGGVSNSRASSRLWIIISSWPSAWRRLFHAKTTCQGLGTVSQPTIIKKRSLSHRIAIQQHGMRGSIISILPADEMGCFCISQAYTRSLGHISGALGAYAEPWAAYHRPSHASGLSFALPRLSWNCRILSLPTVPRRWRVDTFCPRATEALERLQ